MPAVRPTPDSLSRTIVGRLRGVLAATLLLFLVATAAGCSGLPVPLPGAPSPGQAAPRTLEPPLDFRPVTASQAGPCPTPASARGPLVLADPNDPGNCLALANSELTVRQLAQAVARYDDRNAQWVVEISLAPGDVAALERITRRAAAQTDPQNRIALVLGAELVIAPSVMTALTDGRLQISGNLSHQEALDLQTKLGG